MKSRLAALRTAVQVPHGGQFSTTAGTAGVTFTNNERTVEKCLRIGDAAQHFSPARRTLPVHKFQHTLICCVGQRVIRSGEMAHWSVKLEKLREKGSKAGSETITVGIIGVKAKEAKAYELGMPWNFRAHRFLVRTSTNKSSYAGDHTLWIKTGRDEPSKLVVISNGTTLSRSVNKKVGEGTVVSIDVDLTSPSRAHSVTWTIKPAGRKAVVLKQIDFPQIKPARSYVLVVGLQKCGAQVSLQCGAQTSDAWLASLPATLRSIVADAPGRAAAAELGADGRTARELLLVSTRKELRRTRNFRVAEFVLLEAELHGRLLTDAYVSALRAELTSEAKEAAKRAKSASALRRGKLHGADRTRAVALVGAATKSADELEISGDVTTPAALERLGMGELLGVMTEGGADPERLLLAAAMLDSRPLADLVASRFGATGTTGVLGDGRIARVVGSGSSNPDIAAWFSSLGALLGRYSVKVGRNAGRAVHRSATSLLLFARDERASGPSYKELDRYRWQYQNNPTVVDCKEWCEYEEEDSDRIENTYLEWVRMERGKREQPQSRTIVVRGSNGNKYEIFFSEGEAWRQENTETRCSRPIRRVRVGAADLSGVPDEGGADDGCTPPDEGGDDDDDVVNLKTETEVEEGNVAVALKFMANRDEFEREVSARHRHNINSSIVVGVLGWHTPAGEPFAIAGGEQQQRPEPTEEGSEYPYLVVMRRGGESLHTCLASQRIAGFDVTAVRALLRSLLQQTSALHQCGLVHGDLKPRNVLCSDDINTVKLTLCDLDAAATIGSTRPRGLKVSTAYIAPEFFREYVKDLAGSEDDDAGTTTVAADVWSLGVIAYELLSGRGLFRTDISNDDLVDAQDVMRLCVWCDVSDETLNAVLEHSEDGTTQMRARDFVRRCLRGDAAQRPTLEELIAHPLLCADAADAASGASVLPMRYHVFCSHMQVEASGDVGTLTSLFCHSGLNVWRDMEQDDLTAEGMKRGVEMSDVFVLFLTNSTLSRPFCRMELTWAISFKKPIIIVVETEERFWAWDEQRWRTDCCTRASGGGGTGWTTGWLAAAFQSCPAPIVELISRHCREGKMLPFRRREFEAAALTREVVRRASSDASVSWGSVLPESRALGTAQVDAEYSVQLVYSNLPRATAIAKDLRASLEERTTALRWWEFKLGGEAPTHVLLLLTRGVLEEGSASLAAITKAVELRIPLVPVYLEEERRDGRILESEKSEAWDFSFLHGGDADASDVIATIAAIEALKYRAKEGGSLDYEHHALVLELLRRMR